MPHITVPAGTFGIRSLFAARPDTAGPLRALAEALLRGPSPLARGERELIAAYTSALNQCTYCRRAHGAFAARQLEGGAALVEKVLDGDLADPRLTPKLRALLAIAARVQRGGSAVADDDVAAARAAGADDDEIHDAVLVAAAFCMFNRYVDGLAATAPEAADFYAATAEQIVTNGYEAPAQAVARELVPSSR
jgi:uncharacterized peroxidase-related enzyme